MGQIEVTLPTKVQRQRERESAKRGVETILELLRELEGGIEESLEKPTPEEREEFSRELDKIESRFIGYREALKEDNLPPEKLREIVSVVFAVQRAVSEGISGETEETLSGQTIYLKFQAERPQEQTLSSFALQEIEKIRKRPKPERIPVPKDLMDTQTHTGGETLEYITDPTTLREIKDLQSKGRLLAGTLEGLSGGGAYLKSFTIALAQTLNEQSKYYRTEGDLSGVKGLIEEKFGKEVQIVANSKVPRKGGTPEDRPHPYILVSYEDLASKMRGKGKKRGGKDSEYIREYIDKLSGKQYLLDGGTDSKGRRILSGVPFLIRLQYFYLEGKEVGCLLCLSPQFSKTIRGYTPLRADTIQRIGGGRQKDITMSLLDRLLYVRGTDKGNTWEKNKETLLSDIATSTIYKGRPKRREEDFREAIQKVKDSGLIIDYKERTTSWGDTISVFTFNPDYFSKGERESPDEQTGEE